MNTQKINVIDLEATCWDGPFGSTPDGQRQEIIEIGVAVVDMDKRSIVDNESIYVKNTHSYVSDFCTELTGITAEKLEREGVPYQDAIEKLESQYSSFYRPFVSWGDFDRNQFKRDCEAKDVKYPFLTHLNIKTIDAIEASLSHGRSMDTALNRRGIELEGKHHSGKDDAYNTAKILLDIF
jgi:inhibitor of KinA sporulation pathway (predicted exonuclease)